MTCDRLERINKFACLRLQLLALERPCRTGGRRAAELLLAAASGRLTWEQVLVGAVCSAQLEAESPAAGAACGVVPCNGCHARHNEACGQPQAAGDGGLAACWRSPAPDTGRRDWLSHGEVQALYQTQLGAVKTLQYIEAHRAEVDQGAPLGCMMSRECSPYLHASRSRTLFALVCGASLLEAGSVPVTASDHAC